jgi:peptidoglycan/LPS O-acetylase OafA/YrhL
VAISLRSPQAAARLVRWLPLAALGALVGLLVVRITDQDFFFWSRQMATVGYTLLAILFGALLVGVLRSQGTIWARLFSSRFMTQCGKYSYALYMVHVPVAGVLFPFTMRALDRLVPVIGYELVFLIFVLFSFVVSAMLAIASWYLFEKRILALKRYFSYAEADAEPGVAAAPRSVAHRLRG